MRLFSSNQGFVLTDALIAIVIVSSLALLTQSTVQMSVNTKQQLDEAIRNSEEDYEFMMKGIGECICTSESAEEEPAEDISSNSC